MKLTEPVVLALKKAILTNHYLRKLSLDHSHLPQDGAKDLYNTANMRLGSIDLSHEDIVSSELQSLKNVMEGEEMISLNSQKDLFRSSVRKKAIASTSAPRRSANIGGDTESAVEVLKMCFGPDKEEILREMMLAYDLPAEVELTMALDEFVTKLLPLHIESTRTLLCLCDELYVRLPPSGPPLPDICSRWDVVEMKTVYEYSVDFSRELEYFEKVRSFSQDHTDENLETEVLDPSRIDENYLYDAPQESMNTVALHVSLRLDL